MPNLPIQVEDAPAAGPRFFALVHANNPDRVTHYGIDVGTGAFTVRRDPVTGHTTFGSWNSMTSALAHADRLTGTRGQLALVVFDSVPVAAISALFSVNQSRDDPDRRSIEGPHVNEKLSTLSPLHINAPSAADANKAGSSNRTTESSECSIIHHKEHP